MTCSVGPTRLQFLAITSFFHVGLAYSHVPKSKLASPGTKPSDPPAKAPMHTYQNGCDTNDGAAPSIANRS